MSSQKRNFVLTDPVDPIELIGVQFSGPGKHGDFSWMIQQDKYKNALFIYNENEEQFKNKSCSKGSGNAGVRPYRKQCTRNPRSSGIPTGRRVSKNIPGVYQSYGYDLLENSKPIIDEALNDIRELLKTGKYHKVYFSADKFGKLGSATFNPSEDVINYITTNLIAIVKSMPRDMVLYL